MEFESGKSNDSVTSPATDPLSVLPFVLSSDSFAGSIRETRGLTQRLSPIALAYLGDAVYELYIRAFCLAPPKRLQDYHNQVVSHVRAESQASYLQSLQSFLTEAERDILRRGRNAVTRKPKRLDAEIYQQASGFEALLGYLYITDPQRLLQLLNQIRLNLLAAESKTAGEPPSQELIDPEGKGSSS